MSLIYQRAFLVVPRVQSRRLPSKLKISTANDEAVMADILKVFGKLRFYH
jgi:hypothetical protein